MNDTLSGKRRLQLLLSLRSSSEIVLETSTGSILAAVGLYGNVLVLIVVYKTPRLRNSAGILIRSLAISELAMEVLQIPLFLSSHIAGRWLGGFHLYQVSGYSVAFLVCMSLQTMALMALDRHFCIAYPLRHRISYLAWSEQKRWQLLCGCFHPQCNFRMWQMAVYTLFIPVNASAWWIRHLWR